MESRVLITLPFFVSAFPPALFSVYVFFLSFSMSTCLFFTFWVFPGTVSVHLCLYLRT
ncbi:hypothetical protein BJV82DRAFT_176001 [Fennellomyces sp. T-0311]|nr:hypothetical protein BJV82DRAFT_176001 [Fennellomyces sp. T-0311]